MDDLWWFRGSSISANLRLWGFLKGGDPQSSPWLTFMIWGHIWGHHHLAMGENPKTIRLGGHIPTYFPAMLDYFGLPSGCQFFFLISIWVCRLGMKELCFLGLPTVVTSGIYIYTFFFGGWNPCFPVDVHFSPLMVENSEPIWSNEDL